MTKTLKNRISLPSVSTLLSPIVAVKETEIAYAKLCKKRLSYKSQTSDCHVETNKSRADINSSHLEIEVTLSKKLF